MSLFAPFFHKRVGHWLAHALLGTTLTSTSMAADFVQQPYTNLGDTSFLDGVAGPGKLFQISTSHYSADSFKNGSGDSLPGNNDCKANAVVIQRVDLTEHKIFGAYYGWEFLQPIVDLEPDTTLPGLPNKGESGLGDLIFSPFILQWTDSTLFGKPYFHRLNAIFFLPTGDYSKFNDVNTGANTWRFNPYYAATLMLTDKWAATMRLHYLWSSKNNSPNLPSMIAQNDTQAGDAFHMNFASSYEVSPGFRVGLAGYYFNQMGRDRIDGKSQTNSGEKLFAIGPGFIWQRPGGMLTVNSYFETGVENRTEGYKIVARYAWMFH